MADSQPPKSIAPRFEVPDLELGPLPRPARATGTPSPFEDDFMGAGPAIELALDDEPPDMTRRGPSAADLALADLGSNGHDQPASTIDPLELSRLANYGEPPNSPYSTPAYAYRVFTRRRALKNALRSLETECARAQAERDNALAELARAVRPDIEQNPAFRELFAALLEHEQLANARGRVLSSVNEELTLRARALDAELSQLAARSSTEQARASDAQRWYERCDAAAQRAEAKSKRAHIEIRAAMQVAQQKPGALAGASPEPETSELATLKERAAAAQPELERAQADLEQARATLERASASVAAVQRGERVIAQKKQALVQQYQLELELRARGMTDSEQAQRAILVDIGRAVLAARGAVFVPEPWPERVRSASDHANALSLRCELHLRALDAYDRPRAAQGVRLACTCAALLVLMVALKLAL